MTGPGATGSDPESEAPDDPDSETSDPESEASEDPVARIRERAEAVREREAETALARLDAEGDLSHSERAAVERLAERLVARLVAVPERALSAEADEETVENAKKLFG